MLLQKKQTGIWQTNWCLFIVICWRVGGIKLGVHQVVFEAGSAVRDSNGFFPQNSLQLYFCQSLSVLSFLFCPTGLGRVVQTTDYTERCVCVEVYKYGFFLCTKFCCVVLVFGCSLTCKPKAPVNTIIYKTVCQIMWGIHYRLIAYFASNKLAKPKRITILS